MLITDSKFAYYVARFSEGEINICNDRKGNHLYVLSIATYNREHQL